MSARPAAVMATRLREHPSEYAVADGLLSAKEARRDYAVALTSHGSVDEAETARLRDAMSYTAHRGRCSLRGMRLRPQRCRDLRSSTLTVC